MWKDSYLVGVELIDDQHKELFRRIDKLLKVIEKEDYDKNKVECMDAFKFLQDYTVEHFGAEEAYQESIGYAHIDEHKKLHKGFIDSINDYENKLNETDFDLGIVKSFAGMLTAWLINHVADIDQQIPKGKAVLDTSVNEEQFIDNLSSSTMKALEKVVGVKDGVVSKLTQSEVNDDDIVITVETEGDEASTIEFVFPKESALNLLQSMTMSNHVDVDEFVCSALSEVVNIISKKSISMTPSLGTNAYARPAQITKFKTDASGSNAYNRAVRKAKESFKLQTNLGELGVNVYRK